MIKIMPCYHCWLSIILVDTHFGQLLDNFLIILARILTSWLSDFVFFKIRKTENGAGLKDRRSKGYVWLKRFKKQMEKFKIWLSCVSSIGWPLGNSNINISLNNRAMESKFCMAFGNMSYFVSLECYGESQWTMTVLEIVPRLMLVLRLFQTSAEYSTQMCV